MVTNYVHARLVPFVGRKHELADVQSRLTSTDCRLLTLTGLGGSGKTRLAIEAASTLVPHFQHGVVFVNLQQITKSDLLVHAISQALGVPLHGEAEPEPQLLNYLREKSLLLLLDNFEHLLAGAPLISTILMHAPAVKIFVTSREALNLQEEWLYPVKGMSVPLSAYATSLEDYEAVQLFLFHAHRIQPDFALADERESVIRICQLSAGLPLAIELATSWLRGLTAAQIASEMQHNLDFVATATRDIEERHRSMRAVFNHSWELLSNDERRVFARLSVFRGGFDRDAAQTIADASLPLLASLVEKSLLQRESSERYEIHELLRQYGEEKLAADSAHAHDHHSRYFGEFVREREIDLKGRRQIEGLEALERDFENIRVAWDWAVQVQAYDILHTMLEGLLWYGVFRSQQHSVNSLYITGLDQITGDGAAYLKACIVSRQCHLLPYEAPPPIIVSRLENSLTIIRQLGNAMEVATCEVFLALIVAGVEQRHFERALVAAEHALTYFRRVKDGYCIALALHAFAFAHYYQGDRQHAMQLARDCAQLRREIGDHYGTARIVLLIAAEAYSIPDYEKAEHFNQEVRNIWRSLRSWSYVAFVDVNLAYLAIFRGDLETAKHLSDEALHLATEVNIRDHMAYALAMSGVIASLEERYADAWQLLMQAQPLTVHTSSIEALEWALPLAACGLHDYAAAREANLRAFQFAQRLNAPGRYFWHLPATCILLAHEGHTERAAELLGLIFTHHASAPAWIERWALFKRLRMDLEATLGTSAYQAAWRRGEAFDLNHVITDTMTWLRGDPTEAPTASSPVMIDPLTPREIEVLRFMAEGLTNPQIAERLVIGIGTVKTHTLNIYRKLDVSNRTQAILHAQERGLLRA